MPSKRGGIGPRTIHDGHALLHRLPILLPHVDLVIHRLDLLKGASESGRFRIVLQVDLLDDFELLLELLSFGVLGVLILLCLGQVFAELAHQLRLGRINRS